MKKDIFIDTNIACKFAKPNKAQVEFLEWLENSGYLMVSKKILNEYNKSCNIRIFIAIIDKLISNNRLVRISNDEIKTFKKQHFTKRITKRLQSNHQDRDHIPLVLLSERKIAITEDDKFTSDLMNIPGFKPIVSHTFDGVDYSNL